MSWFSRLFRSLSIGPSETDTRPVRQEEPIDYSFVAGEAVLTGGVRYPGISSHVRPSSRRPAFHFPTRRPSAS